MSQPPWDGLPGWAEQLGGLIGAGGVSVIVLKVIERVFARDDRMATDRAAITGELRQDIRDLKADLERMEVRLETARQDNMQIATLNTRLQSENETLRERYHHLLSIVQILIVRDQTYRERLGLPQEETPLPDWIYQRVPGPTAGKYPGSEDEGE